MTKWTQAFIAAGVALIAGLGGSQFLATDGDRWRSPYEYDLAAEVLPSECSATGCDLTPAITRTIAACEASLATATGSRAATGCLITIPAGDHTISEPVSICRAYTFRGSGGNQRRANTTIRATTDAFVGKAEGACEPLAEGRLTLEGFALVWPAGAHATPVVGVFAEAVLEMRDVSMMYPDIGVVVHGDVTGTPKSNANTSKLTDVTVQYSRHAGILFHGGDANAGAVITPNITSACQATAGSAERIALDALYGTCGGLVDRSFLGNFFFGAHFAAAASVSDFIFSGASNHAACFGCYVEGGTPITLDAQWSQWIGGIGPQTTGPGFRLEGDTANRFRAQNRTDPANVTSFSLGSRAGAGGFYAAEQSTNSKALRLKWDGAGAYIEDVGNLSTGKARTIASAAGTYGQTALPRVSSITMTTPPTIPPE